MMTNKTIFQLSRFLILVVFLGLTACQNLPSATPASQIPQGDALLRLAPGDEIKLIVYGEETLTNTYKLDEDGNINVPLAGVVKAGGLTKKGLQDKIADILLTEGYQQKPYVTVEIEALRPIYINGEIGNPGSYAYQPTLDIFQTVAMAGGFTPRANQSKILVTRTKDGQRFRFYATPETPIWPGDSIMVYQRLF
jgi:polysaccharide export outer membrane protein